MLRNRLNGETVLLSSPFLPATLHGGQHLLSTPSRAIAGFDQTESSFLISISNLCARTVSPRRVPEQEQRNAN